MAISALLVVNTLGAALLHYAIGLTLYALVLSIIIAARGQGARSTIVLMALCPLAVATTAQHPWVSMGVMGFVLVVVMQRRVFSVAELKTTLRDI